MKRFHACFINEEQSVIFDIRDVDQFRNLIHGSEKTVHHMGEVFLLLSAVLLRPLKLSLASRLTGAVKAEEEDYQKKEAVQQKQAFFSQKFPVFGKLFRCQHGPVGQIEIGFTVFKELLGISAGSDEINLFLQKIPVCLHPEYQILKITAVHADQPIDAFP